MSRYDSRGLFRPRGARAKRLAVVVATAIAATGVTATAYAVWTTTGSGTGTSKAGTAQPLTTTVATTAGTLLHPGGTGDVRITIANANPYPVRVTQIASGGTIVASGGTGTCATHGVTFATQTGTWDVAANGNATYTLAGAASMSTASENGCQNATFAIPVSLTGTSS